MSIPRGRVSVPVVDEVVEGEGAGKEKDRAMPPSEAALMKGRRKTSRPRAICRRTWWGFVGAVRARRGRSTSEG